MRKKIFKNIAISKANDIQNIENKQIDLAITVNTISLMH